MTDPIDENGAPPAADPGALADDATAARLEADADTAGDAGTAGDMGAPPADPPLRVDPDRPSDSTWREPAWFPPRDRLRRGDRRPSPFALVIGLIFIVVGLYYFLDRTLGIVLPRIQWANVWPIALIVLGGLILIRSFQRRA
ncbi:MAG TPA: hypothetical protein VE817_09945 [Candidatus Acidoferrum sp.]|nr:hypothetical protein [Candidatus Acidoferrum sp.]